MGRFCIFLSLVLELLAAGLTYLYGALLVPNVFNLAFWLLDEAVRGIFSLLAWGWLPHLPILAFPLSLDQIAEMRNRNWGWLWLGLYGLVRIRYLWLSPLMQKRAPANILHPNELRWRLIEQCIQHYQQSLVRFLTPPVDFKTPATFQYEEREGILITWHMGVPIIPSSLLTPDMQPVLATLLALELAKYHCADRFIRAWMSLYPLVPPGCVLTWIGVFSWLPMSLVRSKIYKNWCKKRELAYDRFTYLCGQGESLLHMLRVQESKGMKVFATEYEPATAERIGHLEALLYEEYEQMRKLGLEIQNMPGV